MTISHIGRHRLSPRATAGYGQYVGRVGALAVALGVGFAVAGGGAGVAWADDGAGSTSADGDSDSTATSDAPDAAPNAESPAAEAPDAGPDNPTPTIHRAFDLPRVIFGDGAGVLTDKLKDLVRGGSPITGPDTNAPAATSRTNSADDVPAPRRLAATTLDAPADAVTQARTVLTDITTAVTGTATRLTDSASRSVATTSTATTGTTAHARTTPAAALVDTAAIPGVPAEIQEPVTELVNTLLGAFGIAPGMGGDDSPIPAPSFLFVAFQWIRREFERTFANQAPAFATDSPISLVVGQDSTANVVNAVADDPDLDTVTYSVDPANGPQHGTVDIDGAVVTYTPNAGYTGADSFVLVASDASGGFHIHGLENLLNPAGGHTDTRTVNVTVVAANEAPTLVVSDPSSPGGAGQVDYAVTVGDDVTALEDLEVTVTQPADGSGLVEIISSDPATGAYTIRYRPSAQARVDAATTPATDQFSISVIDGDLTTTQTVTVAVDPLDPALLDPIDAIGSGDGELILDTVVNPTNGRLYATVLRLTEGTILAPEEFTVSVYDVTGGNTLLADAYTLDGDTELAGDFGGVTALTNTTTVVDAEGNIYVPRAWEGGAAQAYEVVVIDTTGTVVERIAVTGAPITLAVTPDGSTVYAKLVTLDSVATPTQVTLTIVDLADPATAIGAPLTRPLSPTLPLLPNSDISILSAGLAVDSVGNIYTLGPATVVGSNVVSTDLIVIDRDGDSVTSTLDGYITNLAASADGNHLFAKRIVFDDFATDLDNGSAELVDLQTGDVVSLGRLPENELQSAFFAHPAVSPDGNLVLVTTATGVIVVDTERDVILETLTDNAGATSYFGPDPTFSTDGRTAYVPRDGLGEPINITVIALGGPSIDI